MELEGAAGIWQANRRPAEEAISTYRGEVEGIWDVSGRVESTGWNQIEQEVKL